MFIMGIVSNSGATSSANMQDQIFFMNCPFPIYDGIASLTDIDDFSVSYTVAYGNGTSNDGTFFECTVDGSHLKGANTIIKEYGATFFDTIPYGWLGYIADYISVGLQHLQAFFTLVAFMITPVNFDVLGYTIADLSGIALMFVIGIYIFCYVGIGAFLAPYFIGIVRSVI